MEVVQQLLFTGNSDKRKGSGQGAMGKASTSTEWKIFRLPKR